MTAKIAPTLKTVNKATRELAKATADLNNLQWSNNTRALRIARERAKWCGQQELAAVNRHFDATGEWA